MNDNEKNNINDDENRYIYRYKKDDLKNEESSKGEDNTDKHMENESSEHKKVKEKKKKKVATLIGSALAFGAIAGGTMFGINYAGSSAVNNSKTTNVNNVSDTLSSDNSKASYASNQTSSVESIVKANMSAMTILDGTTTQSSGFGYGTQKQAVTGSGIIIGKNDKELLILTNAHVVNNLDTLTAKFVNNKSVKASVKGSDAAHDVAIVAVPLSEIDNDTMNAISIATLSSNSENTNVGEQVVAIGNSAGLGQNVTVGYISAKDRSIDVEGTTFSNLFVTDAAISSGNSGGALLNMKGEVIGINFAGNTSSNVENMGYTIPIYTVQDLIDSLMTKETRTEVDASESSYLGIAGVDITSTVSQNYGYPQGILIRQVANNSPAQKAGLTQYDILSSFDGQSVSSMSGFQNILKYYKAGETVTITYYHLENNEYVEKTAEVTLVHADNS